MGVKGLMSYLQEHQDKYFQDCKLKDTKLVIDGSNLLHFLYNHFENRSIYGGNYNQFYTKCRDFFNTLLKCNILPIVVFDGADDPDNMKLTTILKRLDARFSRVKKWKTTEILPILSKPLLYQILDELKVPHIATVYEADKEISVLASRYECPVVTNDNDFYVYDLKGGSISMECMIEKERTDVNGNFYIPVKLYRRDTVLKELFNMENDELIFPVFATLIGNDFFNPSGITLNYPNEPGAKMSFARSNIRDVVEYICEAKFESGQVAYDYIVSQLTEAKQLTQPEHSTEANQLTPPEQLTQAEQSTQAKQLTPPEQLTQAEQSTEAKQLTSPEQLTQADQSTQAKQLTPPEQLTQAEQSTQAKQSTQPEQSTKPGQLTQAEQFEYSVNMYRYSKQFTLFDLEAFIANLTHGHSKEISILYERPSTEGNLSLQELSLDEPEQLETWSSSSTDDSASMPRQAHKDAAAVHHRQQDEEIHENSQFGSLSLQDKNRNNLPSWFVNEALMCKMESTFLLNITQNHRLIFKAQFESHELPSSFKCSESIRRVIYRLLLYTGSSASHNHQIQEYHRSREDISTVSPIESLEFVSNLPNLETIPSLTCNERKEIVYATFKASASNFDEIDKIDETSQICILMLSLWKTTSQPTECQVNAVLIGIVGLHIFEAPGANKCLDIVEAVDKTKPHVLETFKKDYRKKFTQQKYMRRVLINKDLIHKVSQFQAIFLHTHHLNTLLLGPVSLPSPSVVLNSTFVYNMCHLLEKEGKRLKNIFLARSPLYCLVRKWQCAIDACNFDPLAEDRN